MSKPVSDIPTESVESAETVPDSRLQPIGTLAPSCAVILRRVLRNKGSEVPVAAFQSSI